MMVFKYTAYQNTIIDGIEQPLSDEYIFSAIIPYTEDSYNIAKEMAIEISEPYDNGIPELINRSN